MKHFFKGFLVGGVIAICLSFLSFALAGFDPVTGSQGWVDNNILATYNLRTMDQNNTGDFYDISTYTVSSTEYQLRVGDKAGNTKLVFNGSNLGIGTLAPAATIHLSGVNDIRIDKDGNFSMKPTAQATATTTGISSPIIQLTDRWWDGAQNQNQTFSVGAYAESDGNDPAFGLAYNGNPVFYWDNTGQIRWWGSSHLLRMTGNFGGGLRNMLDFNGDSSAVNFWQMSNAATGNAVSLGAIGDDGNISINMLPKGTGTLNVIGGSNLNGNTMIDGMATLNKGLNENVTLVTTTVYNITNNDNIVCVNASSAATTTIPTSEMVKGRMLTIKDCSNNAALNNIIIDTQGAEQIEYADTYVLNTNSESVDLFSDGAKWLAK